MTAPYSGDLRERAMSRLDAGESIRSIASTLSISPSSVSKWSTRRRQTGSLAPGKIGGHKRRVLSGERADWLRARLGSAPFTIRGLHQELAARGIKSMFSPGISWSGLRVKRSGSVAQADQKGDQSQADDDGRTSHVGPHWLVWLLNRRQLI